jgi:hypothetical protein
MLSSVVPAGREARRFLLGTGTRPPQTAARSRRRLSMEDVLQLDLDLSALPLDEFAVVSKQVTVEALTAAQAVSSCEGHCCNHCACPCVCCS